MPQHKQVKVKYGSEIIEVNAGQPAFNFSVSIRFPVSDIPKIMERL